MTISAQVSAHYARPDLERSILAALGVDADEPTAVSLDDLAAVDEFHIGGRQATALLASQLGLGPDDHVLDVGCGIGGSARYLAATFGCRVTGVDLTAEYVETATALTARTGLADRVRFRRADALDLPFAAGTFDAVTVLHVGMNIDDKNALCRELRRVAAASATCGIYDVMRTGAGELAYPVPWAPGPTTSFLADQDCYRQSLLAAAFEVTSMTNRRDLALRFFRQLQRPPTDRPSLGLHLLMGGDAAEKVTNMIHNIDHGLVAPVEIIAVAGQARPA